MIRLNRWTVIVLPAEKFSILPATASGIVHSAVRKTNAARPAPGEGRPISKRKSDCNGLEIRKPRQIKRLKETKKSTLPLVQPPFSKPYTDLKSL